MTAYNGRAHNIQRTENETYSREFYTRNWRYNWFFDTKARIKKYRMNCMQCVCREISNMSELVCAGSDTFVFEQKRTVRLR